MQRTLLSNLLSAGRFNEDHHSEEQDSSHKNVHLAAANTERLLQNPAEQR